MTPPPVPSQRDAGLNGAADTAPLRLPLARYQRTVTVRGMRFLIDIEAVEVNHTNVAPLAQWCRGSFSSIPISSGDTLVAVAPAGSPESAGAGNYIVRYLRNDIDPEVEHTFAVFTSGHLANFTARGRRPETP